MATSSWTHETLNGRLHKGNNTTMKRFNLEVALRTSPNQPFNISVELPNSVAVLKGKTQRKEIEKHLQGRVYVRRILPETVAYQKQLEFFGTSLINIAQNGHMNQTVET